FMQGEIYNFSVTHTYQTEQFVRIYIDFNENGDFEDADELLFSSSFGSTAGLTTGSVTIPLTAPLTSSTRLRVINTYSSLSTNSCTLNTTYGETHDYSVEILPPPSCSTPSGLSANVLSLTSAELQWSSAG